MTTRRLTVWVTPAEDEFVREQAQALFPDPALHRGGPDNAKARFLRLLIREAMAARQDQAQDTDAGTAAVYSSRDS